MNIVWVVIFVLCAVIFLYANRIRIKNTSRPCYTWKKVTVDSILSSRI